jgi:thymidylate kinase
MKAVIDTCSLISLVRYYLPFDGKRRLYDFIEEKVISRDIVILDKVVEECKYISKGIVLEKLDFLSLKKNQFRTDDLLPDKKFFNMLEHQFVNSTSTARSLTPNEFEKLKDRFLESADAKLLLYCLAEKKGSNPITLITEETEGSNDNKLFKKLPAICKTIEVDVSALPQFINGHVGLDFKLK